MTERVSTGGNVNFEYEKGHSPKLKKEETEGINRAYEEYYERKRREKKKKVIITAVIVIIVIILILLFSIFR